MSAVGLKSAVVIYAVAVLFLIWSSSNLDGVIEWFKNKSKNFMYWLKRRG